MSSRVPDGYKKTEVGVIPEDWEVTPISQLTSEIGDGIHSTPAYSINGEYYFVNGNNLVDGRIVLSADTKRANTLEFKKYKKNLNNRTILISINGTIGNIAFYESEAIILGKSAAYLNIRENVSKNYFFYALQTNIVGDAFENGLTGTTIRNLGLGTIRRTPIAIPADLEEQCAIAQTLSDIDALIAKLDKLIAKKRHLKTATMQQLLTGKKRLPGFGKAWQVISMARHATLKARIGWQALTTSEYLDGGSFLLVTGTDFQSGQINWSTCHFVSEWRYSQDINIQLKDGDVLLTKDGTIGKVGYVEYMPRPATLNSGVFVIRPVNDFFHPRFLYNILESEIFDDFLRKIFAGSTISHLYQKDFITFEFLAPCIEEQRKIAQVLSDMDTEITALETRRDKTKAIKQGMMQELLTGKTRLV